MAADDAFPFESAANARLQRIKEALMQEIVARLQRLDQSDGKLSSEREALANAARIRSQIVQLLKESGAGAVDDVADASIMDAVNAALASSAPAPTVDNGGMIGFSTDPDTRDSILRSVSGALDPVPGLFGDAASEIRAAIDLGINTGSDLQSVIAKVAERMDVTFTLAQTAVDTSIRGAMRMATIKQAERGAEAMGVTMLYLYLGPDDAKTRPFCEAHVGKAYPLEVLRQMDNGTPLPVVPYCGSYNCRHTLSPLTLEDAERDGYEVVLE